MPTTAPDEDPAGLGEPRDRGSAAAPDQPTSPGQKASPGTPADTGQPTGSSEPGEPESDRHEKPVEISDPLALRALAHPARLAILQHLILDGPATATECAQVAGLSPSACSYHLRALARYGFVEEDPAGGEDRRHRPWRARYVSMTVGSDSSQPEAVRVAGRLLVESVQAQFEKVRANYLDHETGYPPDWQHAAGASQEVLHVTPAELEEITASIHELLARNRRLKRQDQPPGARRVHVMLNFTPWFTPDAAL